jgi:sugar phosphate isomerase/epimerase
MRYSCSTWNYLKPYGNAADLRVALQKIESAGFGAELWLDWTADPGLLHRTRWSETKEFCSGLPALSAHSRLIKYFSMEALLEEMDLCAYLGADPLVCHPRSFGLDVSTWSSRANLQLNSRDRDRIGGILREAAARSLRVALENGPLDLLSQVLELMAGHPACDHLGICVDTGHANMHGALYESPAPQFIRFFKGRLIHLHLHDNQGQEDEHWVPGQGSIRWSEVFQQIAECGYNGHIVFELSANEPEVAAEKAREFVRSHLIRFGS